MAKKTTFEQLLSDPWEFRFFQAVRMLERALPERAAIGRFAEPQAEVARFVHHASLSFPASEIQGLELVKGSPAKVTVNFIGLIGPLGVLPQHYTEFVIGRIQARDHTALEFLNIFQHRLTSAFYRAWEKHRFLVGYERDTNDPFTSRLYDLVGLGTPGLRDRLPVADESFAFYSGFFSLMARSATNLESMLSDYFDVPVEIEQFVGVWRKLNSPDQCNFEAEFDDSVRLGMGAVAGDEIWDQQSRARIRIGPLTAERYRDFLPDGRAFAPLRAFTRMFSGDDIEYELQLILKREEVKRCELTGDENSGNQLGWFTWIKSNAMFDRDPGDTILLLA